MPRTMELEASHRNEKSLLRQRLRDLRREIDPNDRRRMDQAICDSLEQWADSTRARSIAAFWPFDGEPDIVPLLKRLAERDIQVALPLIQPQAGRPAMVFREWRRDTDLVNNRYGIPEPIGTADVHVPDLDLILLPLVGWDETGGRLGMGAGFYDRALQPFAQQPKPWRIGIGYHVQRVAALPAEPWDILLHGMMTERGLIDFTTT